MEILKINYENMETLITIEFIMNKRRFLNNRNPRSFFCNISGTSNMEMRKILCKKDRDSTINESKKHSLFHHGIRGKEKKEEK
jgi:hypothetical protein